MADYSAGKAAVVTGGSRGMGRAIVLALAGRGADVFFNHASGKDAADEAVRASERTGGRVYAVQADLSVPSTAEHPLETAERRPGGLDILVNNAASQHSIAPLADIEFEGFSHVMTVNAATAFLAGPESRWVTGQNLRVTGGLGRTKSTPASSGLEHPAVRHVLRCARSQTQPAVTSPLPPLTLPHIMRSSVILAMSLFNPTDQRDLPTQRAVPRLFL